MLEGLQVRLRVPTATDEHSFDVDSALAPLAALREGGGFWQLREQSDGRRAKKEAAVGLCTLIGCLAARGAAVGSKPLQEGHVAGLALAIDLGPDAAHAALGCALQLLHAGALSPAVLVGALRFDNGRGAAAMVKWLTPYHQRLSVAPSPLPPPDAADGGGAADADADGGTVPASIPTRIADGDEKKLWLAVYRRARELLLSKKRPDVHQAVDAALNDPKLCVFWPPRRPCDRAPLSMSVGSHRARASVRLSISRS
jgi:hypothetical protein